MWLYNSCLPQVDAIWLHCGFSICGYLHQLFQAIQTILTGIDQQRLLELLLYSSSYYGLNINVKIFEAVMLLLQQQNSLSDINGKKIVLPIWYQHILSLNYVTLFSFLFSFISFIYSELYIFRMFSLTLM